MSKRRLVVVGHGMGGRVQGLVAPAWQQARVLAGRPTGRNRAIRDRTRASTGCGSCTPEVQQIVDFACGVLPYVGVGTLGHGRA